MALFTELRVHRHQTSLDCRRFEVSSQEYSCMLANLLKKASCQCEGVLRSSCVHLLGAMWKCSTFSRLRKHSPLSLSVLFFPRSPPYPKVTLYLSVIPGIEVSKFTKLVLCRLPNIPEASGAVTASCVDSRKH